MAKKKGLSPSQQQAVMLEAEGMSREEISRLGVASPGTISRWRTSPEYQEAIATLAESNIEAIEPLFQKVRVELVQAALTSISTLLDAQQATHLDEDGNEVPNHPVRTKAAIGILDKLREAGILSAVGGDSGGQQQGGNATAAVIVVQETSDGSTSTTIQGTASELKTEEKE